MCRGRRSRRSLFTAECWHFTLGRPTRRWWRRGSGFANRSWRLKISTAQPSVTFVGPMLGHKRTYIPHPTTFCTPQTERPATAVCQPPSAAPSETSAVLCALVQCLSLTFHALWDLNADRTERLNGCTAARLHVCTAAHRNSLHSLVSSAYRTRRQCRAGQMR